MLAKQLLVVFGVLGLCASVQAALYAGPLGSNPDPFVVFHDGYYYYTGTGGDGDAMVVLHRAKTLQELKYSPTRSVWTKSQNAAVNGPCCHFWAPELHRINDKWYMYFSAVQGADMIEDKMHRNYVLENVNADPFAGEWTFKGQLKDSLFDYWAIDITILQHRGSVYALFSGHEDNDHNEQRLYINKMENPWTLVPGRVEIKRAEYEWEMVGRDIVEGPEVLIKNGRILVSYSGNGCFTNQYNLGLIWMDESDDPMNAVSWKRITHPVFSANPSVTAFGPGHNSFFSSPDGKESWMAYHAAVTNDEGCGINRLFTAVKLNWNADGFPNFGVPIAAGLLLRGPSGEPALPTNAVLANGVYEIVNVASGRAVDLPGCNPISGHNIHQWDRLYNNCQKWIFHNVADDYYAISSVSGGMMFSIKDCSTKPESAVWLYKPRGHDCQLWRVVSHGDGVYSFISKSANLAFDLHHGNADRAADYIVWNTNYGNPQKFKLIAA